MAQKQKAQKIIGRKPATEKKAVRKKTHKDYLPLKPGDVIPVKVGGKTYDTVIDEDGIQRFKRNAVLQFLFDEDRLDLDQLAVDYTRDKKFSQRSYAEFNMALGYSVSGFANLSFFKDMEIENPLWRE